MDDYIDEVNTVSLICADYAGETKTACESLADLAIS